LLGNSSGLAKAGATLIINLSASYEIVGRSDYRRTVSMAKSGGLLCAYVHVNAGIGESTTDMVFAGHNIISENGVILSESELFKSVINYADIDFQKLQSERIRSTDFVSSDEGYRFEFFSMEKEQTNIERKFSQTPFIPDNNDEIANRCSEIHQMQAVGLVSRMKHIGCKNLVLGLSGGLDSTLALIVAVHAMDMLELDRKGIIAVTMPCFGTSDRTYNNACRLAKAYGITLKEIDIKDSVLMHFKDIGHDVNNHDSTYENAQARERTQILMDIANQQNGLLIGTGDLSESALGWTTYNGDHMSMYSVNASIPKTLMRHMVSFEAENSEKMIKSVLIDINQTPISPELLPPSSDGEISQKTEDIVGPYELHDFFLYYVVRYGYEPKKIYRMAKLAFEGAYSNDVILKWEKVFLRRFFSQQFKRSCSPDGIKIGSVSLSPRGSFIMPSDACVNDWLKSLDECD
ncbi:MAG TPA: NAD(+) synthase, partial [Clostridiales bacterium]|nr:NAD(+) synthase [Clostridiales bacterium]